MPGVVDSVAVTEEAAGGESVLVVYTTLDGETATARTATVLREACAEWLPAHMVPNRITVVSEMPLVPSGKLDRARLSTDTELRVTLRLPPSSIGSSRSPRTGRYPRAPLESGCGRRI